MVTIQLIQYIKMKIENLFYPSPPKLGRISDENEEIQIVDRLQPHPTSCLRQQDCDLSPKSPAHGLFVDIPVCPKKRKKLKIKMPSYKYFPKDFFGYCQKNSSTRESICDPHLIEKNAKFILSQSPQSPLSETVPSTSSNKAEPIYETSNSEKQSVPEKPCEKYWKRGSFLFQQLARKLHKGRILTKVKTVQFNERQHVESLSEKNQLQSSCLSLSCCNSTELLDKQKGKIEVLSKTLLEGEKSANEINLPTFKKLKMPIFPVKPELRNEKALPKLHRILKSTVMDSTVDFNTQTNAKFRNLKFKMPLKLDSLPILYEDKMSSKSTAHSELISTKRFERKLILPSASSKKQIKLYTHSHLEEEDPNNLTFGKSEQA